MKPRSTAILLAFCASALFTLYGQSDARTRRLEETAKQLHLTHHQEQQLIPILKAEEPKLEAIKNDPSLSRAQKMQQLQAVHDQKNPQLKSILTPPAVSATSGYPPEAEGAGLRRRIESMSSNHKKETDCQFPILIDPAPDHRVVRRNRRGLCCLRISGGHIPG